jgi:hypothetical protein
MTKILLSVILLSILSIGFTLRATHLLDPIDPNNLDLDVLPSDSYAAAHGTFIKKNSNIP